MLDLNDEEIMEVDRGEMLFSYDVLIHKYLGFCVG